VTNGDVLTAVNRGRPADRRGHQDGNISQFLVKPIDYLTYRLCLFCSAGI